MTNAIPDTYRHKAKLVRADTVIEEAGARIKYYDIHARDDTILPDIKRFARDFIEKEALPSVAQPGDLGFVMLHKCGEYFHFLLLQIWRGANEIWEAVYHIDNGMEGFAPFLPANPGPPAVLRPTFCVWEMGVVAFETRAWSDFLHTTRDDAAQEAYLSRVFEGDV